MKTWMAGDQVKWQCLVMLVFSFPAVQLLLLKSGTTLDGSFGSVVFLYSAIVALE